MTQTAQLMTITIKEGTSGLYFATSENEPTFFVSATSAVDLREAVTLALEGMFRSRQLDMVAFPTDGDAPGSHPWAIVPRELVAEGARRAAV